MSAKLWDMSHLFVCFVALVIQGSAMAKFALVIQGSATYGQILAIAPLQ